MKKGIEYHNVAKEIIDIMAKYEATIEDTDKIMYISRQEIKRQKVVSEKDVKQQNN